MCIRDRFKTADRPVRGDVLRELKEVEEEEAAAAGASISAQVEDSLECHCCRRSLAQEIMEDDVYICALCEVPHHEGCVRIRRGFFYVVSCLADLEDSPVRGEAKVDSSGSAACATEESSGSAARANLPFKPLQ